MPRLFALFIGIASLLYAAPLALGQSVQSPGAVPAPIVASEDMLGEAAPTMTHNDIDAFVSGIMGEAIANHQIAGAIVAITKDGETLLAKGYGQARLSPPQMTNGDRHLFRLASISKTFTWIALFQLLENGQIQMEDPINTHLPADLRIPDQGFQNPIRISHLLQHQNGFEDLALGHLFIKEGGDVPTLHEYLNRYRPDRVREAGRFPSYSNYGVALAGAIISEISGLPFESYVEERILQPLNMMTSGFREPFQDGRISALPASDMERFAKGMKWEAGNWIEQPFIHMNQIAPAASFSSTALDMSRYLRALTAFEDGGELILSRHYWDQLSQGLVKGFFSYDFGAIKGFGHDGSAMEFFSRFLIDRKNQLGILISVNSASGSTLVSSFPKLIQHRYFPEDIPTSARISTPSDYEGYYRTSRRPYSGFKKALLTLDGTLHIKADVNSLRIKDFGSTRFLYPIDKDHFRNPETGDIWAFERGKDGQIRHVNAHYQTTAYEKLPTLYTPGLGLGIWLGALVLAIAVLARRLLQRYSRIAHPLVPPLTEHLLNTTAVLWLVFSISLVSYMGFAANMGSALVLSYPEPMVYLILILGVLLSILITTNLISLFWLSYRQSIQSLNVLKYGTINLFWAVALLPLWEIGLISLTP